MAKKEAPSLGLALSSIREGIFQSFLAKLSFSLRGNFHRLTTTHCSTLTRWLVAFGLVHMLLAQIFYPMMVVVVVVLVFARDTNNTHSNCLLSREK